MAPPFKTHLSAAIAPARGIYACINPDDATRQQKTAYREYLKNCLNFIFISLSLSNICVQIFSVLFWRCYCFYYMCISTYFDIADIEDILNATARLSKR